MPSSLRQRLQQADDWEQMNKLERWAKLADEKCINMTRVNRQLRTALECSDKELAGFRLKASKMSELLAVAEAERKRAEEYAQKLEVKFALSNKGAALLKSAALQQELSAAQVELQSLRAEVTDKAAEHKSLQTEVTQLREALSLQSRQLGLEDYEPLLDLSRTKHELQRATQNSEALARQLKLSKQATAVAEAGAQQAVGLQEQLALANSHMASLEGRLRSAELDKVALLEFVQELQEAKEQWQAELAAACRQAAERQADVERMAAALQASQAERPPHASGSHPLRQPASPSCPEGPITSGQAAQLDVQPSHSELELRQQVAQLQGELHLKSAELAATSSIQEELVNVLSARLHLHCLPGAVGGGRGAGTMPDTEASCPEASHQTEGVGQGPPSTSDSNGSCADPNHQNREGSTQGSTPHRHTETPHEDRIGGAAPASGLRGKEWAGARAEASGLRSPCLSKQEAFQAICAQVKALLDQLQDLRASMCRVEEIRRKLVAQNQDLSAQVRQLTDELAPLRAHNQELAHQVVSLEQCCEEAVSKAEECTQQLHETQAAASTADHDHSERLQQALDANVELEGCLARTEAQERALQRQVADLQQQVAALTQQLQASQQAHAAKQQTRELEIHKLRRRLAATGNNAAAGGASPGSPPNAASPPQQQAALGDTKQRRDPAFESRNESRYGAPGSRPTSRQSSRRSLRANLVDDDIDSADDDDV
ncbi:hypothetical protein WJX72_004616 [[Myrmecia] bisecta]|uniref:Uncharacterized protein n=1 Tax=[Myrmecia] bisecta TaxID=41462 RepID=A0AAW1QQA7_9CHLO